MSHRTSGARGGTTAVERSLLMLAKSVERLAARVARIEGSNRGVPPDTVLERDDGDAGDYTIWLRRVSTDERWRVAPFGIADGGVTPEYVVEQINEALANLILPPPSPGGGVTMAQVNDAIATAFETYESTTGDSLLLE